MNERTATYEQTLLAIARSLPPERAAELLDFARFLQNLVVSAGDLESEETIRASEEKWDALFAQPQAQRAMIEMAREARADFQAGRTTDIAISEDGRLVPK
ncbi:MAG: DUF2281 domain-containing protein [Anaerolineae bacterium]|nr:DUF2281 domain-containing protein [Anaerolineae bacterium]